MSPVDEFSHSTTPTFTDRQDPANQLKSVVREGIDGGPGLIKNKGKI